MPAYSECRVAEIDAPPQACFAALDRLRAPARVASAAVSARDRPRAVVSMRARLG